jgi:phosphoglycerol transferase
VKELITRLAKDERVRFLVTGGINTVVGYLLFAAIQFLLGRYVGYIGSVLLSHLLASTVAFILYRRVVFRVRGSVILDFFRFQTIYALPLLINILALPFLVEVLGWNVYIAQAVVMGVTVTLTYLGHKFFSFRRPSATADQPESTPLTWRTAFESEPMVYVASGGLTAVATTVALALWRADWRVPFSYNGDAIASAAQIKVTLETGWYEVQPLLNAPHGQLFYDFSTADHLGLLFAKLASLFTTDYAVIMNVFYVLTFLAAALTATWFIRLVGVSKLLTVALAVLYAIAPYHFARNEVHIWLSGYFCIPLGMVLVYFALKGRPLWRRNPERVGLGSILTGPGAATVVIAAVVATTGTYYGAFTVVLLTLTAGIHWLATRDWRRLVGDAAASFTVVVFMVVNMLPDLLYFWTHGANAAALVRPPGGTEVYSLKFASLVLPVPGHRIGVLAEARQYYDTVFPIPGEAPALGFVAAFGFVALLGLAVYYATSQRRSSLDETETVRGLRSLSALTTLAFLLATVGGVASIIGLVTASLRGWNRMSIVLALFALAAVGLMLDALRMKISGRTGWGLAAQRIAAGILAVGLVGVGYADQVTLSSTPDHAAAKAAYESDQRLVDSIEEAVGDDASILQLPYREFPESASTTGIADTDQLKFYLHSDSLHWSSGGIKGRPDAEWARFAERLPADRLVAAAAAAGFGGVLIDTPALVADGPDEDPEGLTSAIVPAITEVLGDPVVSSDDDRYKFFSLADAAAANAGMFSEAELTSVGDAIIAPVMVTLQPDNLGGLSPIEFLRPFVPRLFVQSARDEPVDIEISFTTTYALGPATVRFTYEDGTSLDFRVGGQDRTLVIPITAVPGRSYVDISLIEGEPWPNRIAPVFTSGGITVKDIALEHLLERVTR